jgi:aryl-alcohol dehydrogenase-like predicted oxidoreductase
MSEVRKLICALPEIGINYIDTAPAYGDSEARIGEALADLPADTFIVSTKVGEEFEDGISRYDFSGAAAKASVGRSLKRLRRETLDIVFIHSDGRDIEILEQTDMVETLLDLRSQGLIRAVGFSGKQAEGARAALAWADAIMVEFHMDDLSHEPVIGEAAAAGVGVVVKKGLGSGHLPAAESLRFVLAQPAVSSVAVGSLNLGHIRDNCAAAG